MVFSARMKTNVSWKNLIVMQTPLVTILMALITVTVHPVWLVTGKHVRSRKLVRRMTATPKPTVCLRVQQHLLANARKGTGVTVTHVLIRTSA